MRFLSIVSTLVVVAVDMRTEAVNSSEDNHTSSYVTHGIDVVFIKRALVGHWADSADSVTSNNFWESRESGLNGNYVMLFH
jgi:hypothetical protein